MDSESIDKAMQQWRASAVSMPHLMCLLDESRVSCSANRVPCEFHAECARTALELCMSHDEMRLLSAQLLTIQESERKRIAADLHDGIGQSLSLIKFSLESAAGLVSAGAVEEAAEVLRLLVPKVKDALGEVRSISMGLRPSMLDDLGIIATLTWFLREFEKTCREIRFEKDFSIREDEVPVPIRIMIFRILQEAMSNVVKHADADLVRVSLRKGDDALHLSVEDNGQGFDPLEVAIRKGSDRGLGLLSMKERASLSGGSFILESAPDQGTRIRVSWPVDTLSIS